MCSKNSIIIIVVIVVVVVHWLSKYISGLYNFVFRKEVDL